MKSLTNQEPSDRQKISSKGKLFNKNPEKKSQENALFDKRTSPFRNNIKTSFHQPSLYDLSRISILPSPSDRIQPKIKINKPEDKYEREADKVAKAVMKTPASTIQRKCAKCEEEEDNVIQRKTTNEGKKTYSNLTPAIQLHKNKGSGIPIDVNTRTFMESRFRKDFSGVRIHTDRQATKMNNLLKSLAFTHGSDIYFQKNQYNPNSLQGKHLLAHELTHVVQQNGGTSTLQRKEPPKSKYDGKENTPSNNTEFILQGISSLSHSPTSDLVQRTKICSKRLEAPGVGWVANHSYIDDTGRDDCNGAGMTGNYAVTDLVSGNFIRGCATKTNRSADPRSRTPNIKPCNPKPGVSNLSVCLRNAYNAYADPSVYSNEAVAGGAVGGGLLGTSLGGVTGGIGGLIGGAYIGGKLNGPNSNTFAATLASSCCEDASSSGLGWVPGWDHPPAKKCSP